MRVREIPFLGLILVAACFFTACEDPSNVGVGLVGEQGGDPRNVVQPLSVFEPDTVDYITGNASRMLVGSVADPLLGTMSTTAYVDFLQSKTYSSAFRTGPVSRVEFHLVRDYVYGDTTSMVTVRLYDIPSEWTSTGAKSDTSITAGAAIAEFSFPANIDTLVITMPTPWVNAHDATLRVDSVSSVFHGFKIEPVSNTAVVGFDVTESTSFLRIFSGTDSSDLYISKDITNIKRDTPASIGTDRILVQNGFGTAVKLDFELSDSVISVNRLLLQLPTDTTTLKNAPLHFVRPILSTLRIIGLTEDDKPAYVGSFLTIDANGGRLADGSVYFRTPDLNDVVQAMIMDKTDVTHFRILPPSDNTLTPLLLYPKNSTDTDPKVVLTITPVN